MKDVVTGTEDVTGVKSTTGAEKGAEAMKNDVRKKGEEREQERCFVGSATDIRARFLYRTTDDLPRRPLSTSSEESNSFTD